MAILRIGLPLRFMILLKSKKRRVLFIPFDCFNIVIARGSLFLLRMVKPFPQECNNNNNDNNNNNNNINNNNNYKNKKKKKN